MSSRRTENGYYLKKLALAASTDIHLTSEEFKEIVHARLALNEFTHFEEKYYCVCENFRELETTVHDQALNNLIYVVTDAAEFYEAKVNFSRRLPEVAYLSIHQDQFLERLRKRSAHQTDMSKRIVKS